ncbi:MAG: ABC transporter permease [Alphaproteobacteria bacterium]|nr:ABC transporter permease [Alphaproteobacteria bacterium]
MTADIDRLAAGPSTTRSGLRLLLASPTSAMGAAIVLAVVAMAALAPLLAPYDPTAIDLGRKLLAPSAAHWMGTDQAGRDLLSRVIWGARPSLTVGVGAVLLGMPLGVAIGIVSGFYRGSLLEEALMRSIEVLASIPLLVWAIAIVGVIGVGPIRLGPLVIVNEVKIIVILGVLYVPAIARVTYAVASGEAKADYVRARRVQGVGDATIMVSDILPNCLSPVIVQATLLIAAGILIEASLSFIGLGVQPPQPSWGGMLGESRGFIFGGEWWMSAFPGAAISLAVIGFNLFGDGLRDSADPRAVTRHGPMG